MLTAKSLLCSNIKNKTRPQLLSEPAEWEEKHKKFRYLLLLRYLQMHLEALTTRLILCADLHKSILSNEEPSWYKSLPNAFHSHL